MNRRGLDLAHELGRVLKADRTCAGNGFAVAHLEESAREDAEERVATEPLAAFDRLEQVSGRAVVEREKCADRSFEVCFARGA
jgi:hypothetical protein